MDGEAHMIGFARGAVIQTDALLVVSMISVHGLDPYSTEKLSAPHVGCDAYVP
jgi:hypothetical protein